jgi:hypothetical protein
MSPKFTIFTINIFEMLVFQPRSVKFRFFFKFGGYSEFKPAKHVHNKITNENSGWQKVGNSWSVGPVGLARGLVFGWSLLVSTGAITV